MLPMVYEDNYETTHLNSVLSPLKPSIYIRIVEPCVWGVRTATVILECFRCKMTQCLWDRIASTLNVANFKRARCTFTNEVEVEDIGALKRYRVNA